MDRPGFGKSDYGIPDKSIRNQAEGIKAIIEEFPQSYKMIIGHSMGGPIAVYIAMLEPELIDGMLLIAPTIDPGVDKNEWYRPIVRSKIGQLLTPTDLYTSNEEIWGLEKQLAQMDSLYSKITAHTLIIQGTDDILVPWESPEYVRTKLPDSLLQIEYLQNVNHFIPWTHPQIVVQGIMEVSDN